MPMSIPAAIVSLRGLKSMGILRFCFASLVSFLIRFSDRTGSGCWLRVSEATFTVKNQCQVKPEKPDKPAIPDKPVKPVKPEKPEKPGKSKKDK